MLRPLFCGFLSLVALSLVFLASCSGGDGTGDRGPGDGGPGDGVTGDGVTGGTEGEQGEAPKARPSIVVVYCDDLRYDVLDAPVEFPALERLAAEGVRFERSYVTTSRCCPSRASMLTGRRIGETGVRNNHPPVLPDLKTIAEVARESGYCTAWFGKWHLPNAGAKVPAGFDEWAGYEGPGSHFDQVFTDQTGESFVAEGHQADWIFDRAETFIRDANEAGQPFLLFVAPKNPHVPMTPAPRHAGSADGAVIELPETFRTEREALPRLEQNLRDRRSDRQGTETEEGMIEETRRYWELVLAVDEGVAKLDGVLKDEGLGASTLMLLTSDNGQMLGEHGMVQKGLAYEASIRVPLFGRWPDRIPAGTVCDGFALNIDLFPTLARVMGADESAQAAPGQDLLPLVTGEVPPRERFLYEAPNFGGRASIMAIVEPRWKYVRYSAPDDERLFDLRADPAEATDESQNPERRAVLERLRSEMP